MSFSSWWRNLAGSLFGRSRDDTEFFGKRLSAQALKTASETIKTEVEKENKRIEAERRRVEDERRRAEVEKRRKEEKKAERRKNDANEANDERSGVDDRYSISSNSSTRFSIAGTRSVCNDGADLLDKVRLDRSALSASFSQYLSNRKPDPGFSRLLVRYVAMKCDGRASVCYERCGVSRQVYSKIISHPDRGVAKRTVMQLCIGLRLSREEADGFMESAGYSFSPSIYEDVVFSWCLDHAVYNIFDVNELLVTGNCPPVVVY